MCGLDSAFIDTGDGPAVFVILLAGFVVVFAALIVEVAYRPPYWLHAALWLPLAILVSVTLGPLRPIKGAADRAAVSSQGRRGAAHGRDALMLDLEPVRRRALHRFADSLCSRWCGLVATSLIGLGIWQLERKVGKDA